MTKKMDGTMSEQDGFIQNAQLLNHYKVKKALLFLRGA
jgi:hypothetical protein